MFVENPPNNKAVEIENPDLPVAVERDPAEPPQIKGPVDLSEKKKNEEVQLDRPEAGILYLQIYPFYLRT